MERTYSLRHLDFLQLQLLLPSPSSVFLLIQQKRGERERTARNVPKEGNRCAGRGKGGGGGADFFLLSKLPFGSAGGGETTGGAKDSGAAASAAAGGAGVGAGGGKGSGGAVCSALSGSNPAGSAAGASGTSSASVGSGAGGATIGGSGLAVATKRRRRWRGRRVGSEGEGSAGRTPRGWIRKGRRGGGSDGAGLYDRWTARIGSFFIGSVSVPFRVLEA
jgi:hypothetical protein